MKAFLENLLVFDFYVFAKQPAERHFSMKNA
jgi:hypothetical protein